MKTCKWVKTAKYYFFIYTTACKKESILNATPNKNKFKFCPYCGGKLVMGKKVKE